MDSETSNFVCFCKASVESLLSRVVQSLRALTLVMLLDLRGDCVRMLGFVCRVSEGCRVGGTS